MMGRSVRKKLAIDLARRFLEFGFFLKSLGLLGLSNGAAS